MMYKGPAACIGKRGCPPRDASLSRLGGTFFLTALLLALGGTVPAAAGDYALTVYGGRMTEDHWFEALPPGAHFVDTTILVGAVTRTLKSYRGGGITLELEGQIGKYFGDQHHLEFNLPVAARWHRFPWDRSVDTSVAFGLGPSWASEVPEAELQFNRTTQQFLVYWFLEIAAGSPGSDWAVIFRLHHRSKAFGLVAEDGGSNTLALGVKVSL